MSEIVMVVVGSWIAFMICLGARATHIEVTRLHDNSYNRVLVERMKMTHAEQLKGVMRMSELVGASKVCNDLLSVPEHELRHKLLMIMTALVKEMQDSKVSDARVVSGLDNNNQQTENKG